MMEEACDAVAKQVGDRFDEMEQERGLAPTGVNLNGPAAPPPQPPAAAPQRGPQGVCSLILHKDTHKHWHAGINMPVVKSGIL